MDKKCLVVYASKAGSTREVAEKVGEILTQKGIRVDVCSVRQARRLEGYDAVVLGTAVRMYKPLGQMMAFVKRHKKMLSGLPTAAFTVGLALKNGDEKGRGDATKYAVPFIEALGSPKSVAYFGGKLDLNTLSPVWRRIMSKMIENDPSSLGDFRDWNAIQAWADTLPTRLGLLP